MLIAALDCVQKWNDLFLNFYLIKHYRNKERDVRVCEVKLIFGILGGLFKAHLFQISIEESVFSTNLHPNVFNLHTLLINQGRWCSSFLNPVHGEHAVVHDGVVVKTDEVVGRLRI